MTKNPEQAIEEAKQTLTEVSKITKAISRGVSSNSVAEELSHAEGIAADNWTARLPGSDIVIDPSVTKAKKIRPPSGKSKSSSPSGSSRA